MALTSNSQLLSDDVGEGASGLLNINLSLANAILKFGAACFAAKNPVCKQEDPYSIPAANRSVILPVRELPSQELMSRWVLKANVGV